MKFIPLIFVLVLSAATTEKLVNLHRYSVKLPTLKHEQYLCDFANQRLSEVKTDWSHAGFFKLAPSMKYRYLGENLARDFSNNKDMVEAWLASPTHKANIVGRYTHTCVQCSNEYCVQLFRR